jgi:hypothetical protein
MLVSLDMVSIEGKQLEALKLVLDHMSQFYAVLARRLVKVNAVKHNYWMTHSL